MLQVYQERFAFVDDVSDNKILTNCKNFRDALAMAAEYAGKKSQEVIALQLQELGHKTITDSIISSALSKNPSQKRNIPTEAIDDFISLTSIIPVRYLALKFGFGLYRLKTEIEKENEMLKMQLAEKDKEIEIIRNWEKSKK